MNCSNVVAIQLIYRNIDTDFFNFKQIKMKLYQLIAAILLAILFSTPLSAQKAQIKVGYDYEVSNGGQVRKNDYREVL